VAVLGAPEEAEAYHLRKKSQSTAANCMGGLEEGRALRGVIDERKNQGSECAKEKEIGTGLQAIERRR